MLQHLISMALTLSLSLDHICSLNVNFNLILIHNIGKIQYSVPPYNAFFLSSSLSFHIFFKDPLLSPVVSAIYSPLSLHLLFLQLTNSPFHPFFTYTVISSIPIYSSLPNSILLLSLTITFRLFLPHVPSNSSTRFHS